MIGVDTWIADLVAHARFPVGQRSIGGGWSVIKYEESNARFTEVY